MPPGGNGVSSFGKVQAGLGDVWALNRPGTTRDHVIVALPSFSVGESLLSHYRERIPALEHRYLLASLMLHRIESCEMVFVSCEAPGDEIVEYYTALVRPERRHGMRKRFRTLVVPDRSARSVAAKLLDRPELLDQLRTSLADRPAFIEPWNVTEAEVEVAMRVGAPLNGTPPQLWPLGFKSAGRKLFTRAAVPVPFGSEDVRSVDDVISAISAIRTNRPTATSVVIKHDDSGAGDGNVVMDLRQPGDVRARVEGLPEWYRRDLSKGGVVEELVVGRRFTSPSVQVDVTPFGEVVVLATHEQVLSGDGARCTWVASSRRTLRMPRGSQSMGGPSASSLLRLASSGGSAWTSRQRATTRVGGACSRWRSTCARAVRRTRTLLFATSCPAATTRSRADG